MKIVFRTSGLFLIPENKLEKGRIATFMQEYSNDVFVMELQKGNALAFRNLGDYEDVCNVPVNIIYSSTDEDIRLLSNLAFSPFELNGIWYSSVEAFWQGLKYSDNQKRKEIAKLYGKEAMNTGNYGDNTEFFKYQDKAFRIGSYEHWQLMKQACMAKFTQNSKARNALLNTNKRPLIHRTKKESRTIPNPIMADIWMKVREIVRKKSLND